LLTHLDTERIKRLHLAQLLRRAISIRERRHAEIDHRGAERCTTKATKTHMHNFIL